VCCRRPFGDFPALTIVVGAPAVRIWVALAIVSGGLWGVSPTRANSREVVDMVALAPPESVAARLGREVALRFDLGRRFELALQINDAFTAQNRIGIARATALIAAIPGVRKVIGPADLLAIQVDRAGRASAEPLLAGAADDDAREAVRQRVIRRSDAIGWFIDPDGTEIRLLIDTDNLPAVQNAVAAAAASSGLVLLSDGGRAVPLWPEPEREPQPFLPLWPWVVSVLVALAVLPAALVVLLRRRLSATRTVFMAVAAGITASGPALLAPVARLRQIALGVGVGTALGLGAVVIFAELVARARVRPVNESERRNAPIAIVFPSVLLLLGASVFFHRISMGTQFWRDTTVFFVDLRGDLDEPIVIREVRRLTDFLRAEPGVAHAWSIADLFFAVPVAGEEVSGIPLAPPLVQAILARARDDAAARLELGPDHREALIGVRLDEESGVDRLVVLDHLEQYLDREHRSALLRIDLSDGRVPPAARALGRGILAADASTRVLRICSRSGRNLNPPEVEFIDRTLRRAALIPIVDSPRLRAEIAQEVNAFVEQVAVAESQVEIPRPLDRQRLAQDLMAEPADSTVADVLRPLRALWGRRLPPRVLEARAGELQYRLRAVRRAHTARINFHEILHGADLPTEGVLSEEVRDATLEAMGPIVGLPVDRQAPGAMSVDAVAVGGAPCDRALSRAWLPRMKLGIALAATFTALLLVALGGFRAFLWWPTSLAFGAPLLLVPAIAGVPIGALYVAVLSGALAAGSAFAVALAPGRRDW
jgi:hypothetical protein